MLKLSAKDRLLAVTRLALPYLGAIDDVRLSRLSVWNPRWTEEQRRRPLCPLGPKRDKGTLHHPAENVLGRNVSQSATLLCPMCELVRMSESSKPRVEGGFATWRSCCSKHGRLHDQFHYPVNSLRDLFRTQRWVARSPGCKFVNGGTSCGWAGHVLYYALYGDRRAGWLEQQLATDARGDYDRLTHMFTMLALILMRQLDVCDELPEYDWEVYCALPVENRYFISVMTEAILALWGGVPLPQERASQARTKVLAVLNGFWPGPQPKWSGEYRKWNSIYGTEPSEEDLRSFASLVGTKQAEMLCRQLLAARRHQHRSDHYRPYWLPRAYARMVGHLSWRQVESDRPAQRSDPPIYCW